MKQAYSCSNGLPLRPRVNETNPRFSQCATHLRRCCGVCVYFDGDIIRTTARCNLLGGLRSGLVSAADCQDWARKSAGVGAS